MLWAWTGPAVGMDWACSGHGLGLLWAWTGPAVGMDWAYNVLYKIGAFAYG